ncbi:hypothetical protein C6361_10530 [Plantactinospora sp. BC1]|uniref:pentapeptide repeat-containing protein n=1 Tax=Plantactinospora sp. BC1 TaxID=2108470 RepID=UPI000D15E19D|nr:pentapeptide repeat-containing protein [Plantactinospora sp. BC1]AVT29856.1 hypothetical protein C6361_10530 [Plantactinospora sp. BC1]
MNIQPIRRSVLLLGVPALVLSAVATLLAGAALRAAGRDPGPDPVVRFTAAVKLLADPSEVVRAGGVHALEGLLREAPIEQPTVTSVLATFVRRQSQADVAGAVDGSAGRPAGAGRRPGVDVQAALTVIGRRDVRWDRPGDRVDLTGAVLTGVSLVRARLTGALLTGARLDGADLTGARLDRVDLDDADLRGAVLDRASLREARLHGADLTEARINMAMLDRATLAGAVLVRAALDGTGLTGAVLVGADLRGARLDATNLTAADLTGANLSDAYLGSVTAPGAELVRTRLVGANLVDIDLTDARLTGANLNRALMHGATMIATEVTAEQISCAVLSDRTRLPAAMTTPGSPAPTCAD